MCQAVTLQTCMLAAATKEALHSRESAAAKLRLAKKELLKDLLRLQVQHLPACSGTSIHLACRSS